jgi:hypothetical protein
VPEHLKSLAKRELEKVMEAYNILKEAKPVARPLQ